MQARVESRGDITIVHLIGRVDIETSTPFRKACLTQLLGKRIVFNFTKLSFVGSSGLIPFFECLYEYGEKNEFGLKFCGMGLEFRKILSATPLVRFEVLESEQQAILSYERPAPVVASAAPLEIKAEPVSSEIPVVLDALPEQDLFQLVRSSFEDKMRRPLELDVIKKEDHIS